MKKAKVHIHPMLHRIIRIEVQLNQLDRRLNAQQLVLGWLLARQPGDEAMRFLSAQANELEGSSDFEEAVAELDDLREEIARWRAQWQDDHKDQR